MKWLALLLLACAVLGNAYYLQSTYAAPEHSVTWWTSAAITAGFALLLLSAGSVRWLASPLRICLGCLFVLSACEAGGFLARFGISSQGLVTVAHTIALMPALRTLLHAELTPQLVWISLALEAVIGIGLVTGIAARFFSLLAFVVLGTCLAAVALTGGPIALPFDIASVLATGALVLAAVDSSGFAMGGLRLRDRSHEDPFLAAFDQMRHPASRFRTL